MAVFLLEASDNQSFLLLKLLIEIHNLSTHLLNAIIQFANELSLVLKRLSDGGSIHLAD
jgi:hypothetical protein